MTSVDTIEITQSYGMFSDRGNFLVDQIVNLALLLNSTWSEVNSDLEQLAKDPEFEEATDTAVREAVYSALGFSNK